MRAKIGNKRDTTWNKRDTTWNKRDTTHVIKGIPLGIKGILAVELKGYTNSPIPNNPLNSPREVIALCNIPLNSLATSSQSIAEGFQSNFNTINLKGEYL